MSWRTQADDKHAALLHAYLQSRDVACPHCGYNLRDTHGTTCPECGSKLELAVRQSQTAMSWAWVVLMLAMAFQAGRGSLWVWSLILDAIYSTSHGLPWDLFYLSPMDYLFVGSTALCWPGLLIFALCRHSMGRWPLLTQWGLAGSTATLFLLLSLLDMIADVMIYLW